MRQNADGDPPGPRADPGDSLNGRSFMDLEAERVELEDALDRLARTAPGVLLARGLARLNLVRDEIRYGG